MAGDNSTATTIGGIAAVITAIAALLIALHTAGLIGGNNQTGGSQSGTGASPGGSTQGGISQSGTGAGTTGASTQTGNGQSGAPGVIVPAPTHSLAPHSGEYSVPMRGGGTYVPPPSPR